ncbi:MAG: ABC-type transport system, involved in lipoprotein release, permease component [Frankiales bacterium]|nr:ABC-type transport system, involved in lipoprotein release, permease component [Frankiales bacterium]
MFLATVRGMLAHKLRLFLTTASIALGVAFLAGTLILTDTMNTAFDRFFGQVSSGTDSVVRHESSYEAASGAGVTRAPIPASLLPDVQRVPGVAAAEGVVSGYALLTDTDGKAVLPAGGAPTMGYTMTSDVKLRGHVHLLSGRAPSSAHEVAVDAFSASGHHLVVGSRIRILFRGPSETFTVVGTVGFGHEKSFGGTSSAYFTSSTAQRVLGTATTFDEIQVRGNGRISDAELTHRINAVLPHDVQAVTGAAAAKEASDTIKHLFRFVGVLFTMFAAIALFVGSFIIWNTFTMIVTQRSREIALLRAVGASRRQVLRNLLLEAGMLGVIASGVGIGLGIGVAKGLNALMSALGFTLPSTSMQIEARTIWVSLFVGTLVTVVSALVPARRATKVLPIEALRESTPGARPPSRRRGYAGLLLAGTGAYGIAHGLDQDRTNSVLLGVLAAILSVLTLAPLWARPLAGLLGLPLRFRGVPGDLARDNAMRNPRRTASTATALMIGLTMVAGIGVVASSLKASFGTVLHNATKAQLYVTPASGQGGGFSPDVANLVRAVPGVRTVSPTGFGEARVGSSTETYSSVDPATVEQVLKLKVSSGSAALGTDGIMVRTAFAKDKGYRLGQTVPVTFPATGTVRLTIKGMYDGTGYLDGNYVISLATEEAHVPDRLIAGALVLVDKGASTSQVKAGIAKALAAHPDARVLDRKGYEKQIGGLVDQLLALVSVMLLLSVIIALLGIVNTLALSVHERTRELGLLRAVGMTRGQVRAMVRWESVVISLLGASVGAAVGIGIGMALAQTIQGVTQVAVPTGQIVTYVLAAAVAGLLAAVGPSRSAAKVDVLRAVVTD